MVSCRKNACLKICQIQLTPLLEPELIPHTATCTNSMMACHITTLLSLTEPRKRLKWTKNNSRQCSSCKQLAILPLRLTRHLHWSYKVAEQIGIGEVVLKHCVDRYIEQLVERGNREVGVVGTQPVSCVHHQSLHYRSLCNVCWVTALPYQIQEKRNLKRWLFECAGGTSDKCWLKHAIQRDLLTYLLTSLRAGAESGL